MDLARSKPIGENLMIERNLDSFSELLTAVLPNHVPNLRLHRVVDKEAITGYTL